jgi:hypothetical protein
MSKYTLPPNPLLDLYRGNMNTAHSTPAMIGGPKLDTETLPYGGGTYNPEGDSEIKPAAPVFAGAPPAPAAPVAPANDLYEKYRDPKTGEIMSPEEYALSLGDKVPKGTGQIPNYAGDALADPNKSSNELIKMAGNLNNARNDIATGEKDPYGVGNKSGIAYSPAELKAIEKAYAGVYDPALQDVFSRLRDKQAADKKVADMEAVVFRTNEAIRQWQATTGTTKGLGDGGYDFSKSAIADGASNAGMSLEAFKSLESDDIKNFYINPPKGRGSDGTMVPIFQNFEEDILAITDGSLDRQVLVDDITNSTRISPAVKTFFINKIPAEVEEQEKWYDKIWSRMPFVD